MRWFGAFVCGATLLVGIACGQRAAAAPADAVIRDILAERIDTYRGSVGMVVGMIEPSGRRVVAYGRREAGDPRPLDGDTLFEIGSITKVFTALLLADMVARGEVVLADPVGKLLSADAKVPERCRRAITLLDLATHTSGCQGSPRRLRHQRSYGPLRGLFGRPAHRFPFDLCAHARHRCPIRILRPRRRAFGAGALRAAPAWTTKLSCERASPSRSAWPARTSRSRRRCRRDWQSGMTGS